MCITFHWRTLLSSIIAHKLLSHIDIPNDVARHQSNIQWGCASIQAFTSIKTNTIYDEILSYAPCSPHISKLYVCIVFITSIYSDSWWTRPHSTPPPPPPPPLLHVYNTIRDDLCNDDLITIDLLRRAHSATQAPSYTAIKYGYRPSTLPKHNDKKIIPCHAFIYHRLTRTGQCVRGCMFYQMKHNLGSLAWFISKLAHLSMLFILQRAHAAWQRRRVDG